MSPTSPQPADLVVRNIDWLITVDDDRRVLRNAAVAVVGGRFAAVGPTEDVLRAYEGTHTIDGSHRVATPGFVDNHLHSSFHLSRGLADEANAQAFLFQRMYPYEAALTEEDVYVSALLAGWELLRHGVTCFVDPGNYYPEQTLRACQALGIRVHIARSTFDQGGSALGVLPAAMIDTAESALAASAAVLEEYQGPISRGWSASASFRGLNNASDDLIRGLHQLAREHETFLQTHGCFSYSTRDASLAQHGVSEVARLADLGVLDEQFLLVHGGWLQPTDVALLAQHRPTVVHAPSSSVHNGYGSLAVGHVPELLALGVNVSLGSDHASSGSVDMTREMYLAACGHKEVRLDAAAMPPETVLEMATRGGAAGVGAAEDLGAIAIGRLADFALFDTDQPQWQPLHNPVSNLVYSAPGPTVDTVVVGGRVVLESGHLRGVDEDDLRLRVRRTAADVLGRLDREKVLTMRWPVTCSQEPVHVGG